MCRGLEDVGKKTIEWKRKADDAHGRTRSHSDRCRRATKDLVSAEEELNDRQGHRGSNSRVVVWVPDRDCNEGKYLQEALGMIDDFQRRNSRPRSASQGTAEVRLQLDHWIRMWLS